MRAYYLARGDARAAVPLAGGYSARGAPAQRHIESEGVVGQALPGRHGVDHSYTFLASLVRPGGLWRENCTLVAGPTIRERWQVCNQLGGPRATAIAESEQARHMRLVPWAGVAARLSSTAESRDGNPLAAPSGAAYCFLPLPVNTGLPVHVNGYFELSSNR